MSAHSERMQNSVERTEANGLWCDSDWINHQVQYGTPLDVFEVNKVSTYNESYKIPSYGLSSTGYDSRCNGQVYTLSDQCSASCLDPANPNETQDHFVQLPIHDEDTNPYVLIPALTLALTSSLEYFKIPSNARAMVYAKSTYARLGLINLTTPLEAGWQGHVVYELYNSMPIAIKLYTKGGIVQVEMQSAHNVLKDYAARGGKYQNQTGLTHAKL